MRRLHVGAVDAAAFAPFGRLLIAPSAVGRTDFAAPVETLRPAARVNLALVRPPAVELPFRVSIMERHRFSTQAFFPLGAVTPLLLVAPGGDAGPDLAATRAFLMPPGAGLSYAVGTWHMGMATLGQAGAMAMLVHEDGTPDDTEFRPIEPIEIVS